MGKLEQIINEYNLQTTLTNHELDLINSLRLLEKNLQTLIIIKTESKFIIVNVQDLEANNFVVFQQFAKNLIKSLKNNFNIKIIYEELNEDVQIVTDVNSQTYTNDYNLEKSNLRNEQFISYGKEPRLFTSEYTFAPLVNGKKLFERTKNLQLGRITSLSMRSHYNLIFEELANKYTYQELLFKSKVVESIIDKQFTMLGNIKSNLTTQNKVITKRFISLFELFSNENFMHIYNKIEDEEISVKNLKVVLTGFKIIASICEKEENGEEINRRNQKKLDKLIKIVTNEKKLKLVIEEIMTITDFLQTNDFVDKMYINNLDYISKLKDFASLINNQPMAFNLYEEFFNKHNVDTFFYENIEEMATIRQWTFIDVSKYNLELKTIKNVLTLFNNCFYILEA